jgi:hypothetical protein
MLPNSGVVREPVAEPAIASPLPLVSSPLPGGIIFVIPRQKKAPRDEVRQAPDTTQFQFSSLELFHCNAGITSRSFFSSSFES